MKKAGGLLNGCKIDMFIFQEYSIDSAENISFMFTWKYVDNYKYNKCSLVVK